MPPAVLAEKLQPVIEASGCHLPSEKFAQIAPLIHERIRLLNDVLDFSYLWSPTLRDYDASLLVPKKGDPALALRVLEKGKETLVSAAFTHDGLESALRAAAESLGIKAGQMFEPIRVAVCGRKDAPPLFSTLEVIGRELSLARIELAIAKLK